MEEENSGFGFGGLIGGLIGGFMIASFFFPAKYDGETAEFWFNAYDEQVANTEELETQLDEKITEIDDLESQISKKDDCLSEIESKAKYWLSDDYYELRDYLDKVKRIASNCQ